MKYRPRHDYMEAVQGDISHAMRAVLVDWLVEVAEEYKLQPQTLYLSIHYVDRLLSVVAVNRAKLQLVLHTIGIHPLMLLGSSHIYC
jgi:cyclin A